MRSSLEDSETELTGSFCVSVFLFVLDLVLVFV